MAGQTAAAKKAAAKKAESKKAEAQPEVAASSASTDGSAKAPDTSVKDSGPNHDLPDAPPDAAPAYPSTVLDTSSSGPLEAPSDAKLQTKPEAGYEGSSTDHTYAAAGGRTVAGESHSGLVDEDGKKVKASDLFNDDGKTFVTASKRVYETFLYPNTTTEAKRLLFVEGQRVPRAEAERIKATL